MRFRVFIYLIVLVSFAAGCQKKSVETDVPEKAAVNSGAEAQDAAPSDNDAAKDVAKDVAKDAAIPKEKTAEQGDSGASDKPETAKAPEVNPEPESGTARPMPPIETVSECTEFPGGCMRRTSLKWSDKLEYWYDVPEFSIEMPAYTKINKFFKDMSSSAFTKAELEGIWDYLSSRSPDNEEVYSSLHKCRVEEHTDKILSVSICYEWFMGGVFDNGCSGYVFDLASGDAVSITSYTGKSIEEIRKAIRKGLEAQYSDAVEDIDWGLMEKMAGYSYYIRDEKVHVVFKKYEIASGAAGAFDVELAF